MENEYSNKMIEAFIGKSEKTLWYQLSFAKFNINGVDAIKWNWSWWAFFGGSLFLLYRKQYLGALGLFILSMTIGMIPFMGFVIAVLAGGFSTYFVYKGYKSKLNEIEQQIDDEDTRVQTMGQLGGYHTWVVWLYAIFAAMVIFGIISMFLIPSLAL